MRSLAFVSARRGCGAPPPDQRPRAGARAVTAPAGRWTGGRARAGRATPRLACKVRRGIASWTSASSSSARVRGERRATDEGSMRRQCHVARRAPLAVPALVVAVSPPRPPMLMTAAGASRWWWWILLFAIRVCARS